MGLIATAMAMIALGVTRCPLCDEVIEEGHAIVATSHFIADSSDSLWRYSDAAFHKSCFLAWERREEFVDRYNAVMGYSHLGGRLQHYMDHEGNIHSSDPWLDRL